MTNETTSTARSWLTRLAPFIGLIAVIAIFAIMTDTPDQYLSIRNFRIVVAQTVIVALGAIGMTMVMVGGGIDLSVGSVIALSGVVTAIALRDGVTPILAVLEGVLAGGAAGVINGLFVTRMKVIPFIATLGTLGMARGVAKWIADQQTVNPPATWVNNLAVTLRAQGDLPGARRLLEAVLEARKRVLGEEHPGTLASTHELAITLRVQAEATAARQL